MNRASAEKRAEIEASGITPLDYMLSVMRDNERAPADRLDAAHKAAPYVHPRLAAVKLSGEVSLLSHEAALDELDAEGT